MNLFGIIRSIRKIYPYGFRFHHELIKNYFDGNSIIMCEVGVSKGINAVQWLKKFNIDKLYLVDPYKGYTGYHGVMTDEEQVVIKNIMRNRLKKWDNKIVFVNMESNDAYLKFIEDKNLFDFIYIDGNHVYDSVYNDIKNYYELLKNEGIIAGHDYSANWSEVCEAVIDFTRENGIKYFSRDNEWYIIKRM